MVLVLYKNYNFTHKDAGKSVILAGSKFAKILTVIREAGQLHCVYGLDGAGKVIEWDRKGNCEDPKDNIFMILED